MERVVPRGNRTRRARPRRGARARGFTLVEILVTIGIMCLLMGLLVPSFIGLSRQNRRTTCISNLKAIGQALAQFHADYGCYPPDSTEYLWTPAAVKEYQRLYGATPGNDYRLGTLTGAAYHPDGRPFAPDPSYTYYTDRANDKKTQPLHGLGLLTLYYVGAYAAVLPPRASDPRFPRVGEADYPTDPNDPLRRVNTEKGYRQFAWFRGTGYLTSTKVLHCPNNPTELDRAALLDHTRLPGLTRVVQYVEGGVTKTRTEYWNNYDQFYRRNFWNPGLPPAVGGEQSQWTQGDWNLYWKYSIDQGASRNLIQAYPPADTVITWCPYHHRGYVPSRPGDAGQTANDKIRDGDEDLVLLLDGSVRRVVARQNAQMWQTNSGNLSWPPEPVM